MNIFGVGGAELMAILIIMLVVAGPKRMIHWSYILGQYVAKFRVIWSQTVDLVQKEFDEAGLDIKLPKEPPTRQNLNRAIGDAVKPVTKPLQDSIDEVQKDVDAIKEVSETYKQQTKALSAGGAKSAVEAKGAGPAKSKEVSGEAGAVVEKGAAVDMGAWSGEAAVKADGKRKNGKAVDLGSWSTTAIDD